MMMSEFLCTYIGRAFDCHVETTGEQWGINKSPQPGVPITVKHIGASILSIYMLNVVSEIDSRRERRYVTKEARLTIAFNSSLRAITL